MKAGKWAQRYLKLAEDIGQWSKDPSSKIGCVAVEPNTGRILSQGYNGFPRGIIDTDERLNNREIKYKYVVHAEKNCIYNACLSGVSLENSVFYVHGLPCCSECAKGIIQVGVKEVYYYYPQDSEAIQRWKSSNEDTISMFEEAGIKYELINEEE